MIASLAAATLSCSRNLLQHSAAFCSYAEISSVTSRIVNVWVNLKQR